MSETVSDTRRRLTQHVQQFRGQGVEAAPVIFGDRRQPEAALLPYETLSMLLDIAEDVAIAQRIRERHFLVSEVIAVDDRSADLRYLLAGLRLGGLDEPVRRSEAERRIARLRRYRGSD